MKKYFVLTLLVPALTLFGPAAAMAQTPDGETPANEGVCDALIGATPGLYGLCVAYCEAQDCDAAAFEAQQCEPSNQKVLANYNKRKTPSDPDMPCVQTPCPCWSLAELDAIPEVIEGIRTLGCLRFSTISSIDYADTASGEGRDQSARVFLPPAAPRCSFLRSARYPDPISRVMTISLEEAEICRAQVEARCAELGL